MLVILLYFYLLHVGNCLIVFDKIFIDVKTYGNTKVEAYLLAVDIFYKNYGSYTGCDIQLGTRTACDILIYTRLCSVNQAKVSSYTVDYFRNKHTFLVDAQRKTTKYSWPDLNCGEIESIFLGDQRNSWYGTIEDKIYLNGITQPYSEILTFTSYTGDAIWAYYSESIPFGIYDINTEGIKTIIQENMVFEYTKLVSYFNSLMLLRYLIIVKCEFNHFGRTCWFYCTDNIRRVCNCEYKPSYSNVPCNPTCRDGWIPTYIIYTIDEVKEGLTSCVIRDLCYYKKVCKYECLPINNLTYACEKLLILFQSFYHETNITSDVFFYTESFTISLDYNTLVNKEVEVNATIVYDVVDYIFKEGIIIFLYGDKYKTFQIGKNDRTDEVFNLTFYIYLPPWLKYFYRIKYFRIYVKPDELFIFRNEDNTELENIVYIGEALHCNSTARPTYRTIYLWSSLIIKLDFPLTNDIKIPDNTEPRMTYISINATLIIYDRPNEKMSTSYNVFIKPFVYFEWNTQKNVLEPTEYLECRYKAYINFNLLIIQMMGPSLINIQFQNNLIHLKGYEGGEYELFCFFMADTGLQYMKKINFQLKSKPTFICLFLFTNTIGSLVQCGHNGNFYEKYNIDISFNIFDLQWYPAVKGKVFLKIPYYLKSKKYFIQCVVSSKYNNYVNNSYKKMENLLGESQAIYTLTTEFQRCPNYADYVEEPIIEEYLNDGVFVKHFLVYLVLSDFQIFNVVIFFSIFILFIYFTILVCMCSYSGIYENEKTIKLRVKHGLKMLKRRHISFRLGQITNKKTESSVLVSSYFIKEYDNFI